jgi:quercetin dioxygenase-like cupin family protein
MELQSGNLFIREMRFEKAGDVIDGHAHNFDHTTYVIRGGIRIEALGRSVEKRAGAARNWVLIKAGVEHKIISLEADSLAHCIYSHRNAQGEVVQEATGWLEAYL